MAKAKDELTSGSKNARDRHENAVEELNRLAGEGNKEEITPPPKPEPEQKAPEKPEVSQPDLSAVEPEDTSFFKEGIGVQEKANVPEEVDDVPVSPEEKRIIEKIKANGKEHEVDFSDKEALRKLVQKGLGADKAFTNADKYEKEVPALREKLTELEKYKAIVDYLEEAKDDDAELYRRVSGGRTLESAFKKHQEYKTWLATADKSEIEAFELKQRLAKLEKQNELSEKERQDAIKKVQSVNYNTTKNNVKSQLMSELKRVSFAGQLGDEVEETDLDDMIYMAAVREVKAFVKENPDIKDIPQEVMRSSFDKAKKRLEFRNKVSMDKALEEVDSKRSEAAAKKAALASTKNYTSDVDILKEIRKAGGRPTDLFKTIFKK